SKKLACGSAPECGADKFIFPENCMHTLYPVALGYAFVTSHTPQDGQLLQGFEQIQGGTLGDLSCEWLCSAQD
ncbi:MAG: hypothetical protein Q7S52_03275, partial [bacterium]|nr:hypothetical protein [bacterium]